MKKILLAAFFSLILSGISLAQGFTISGTKLLDANGNEFIIKGVNVPLAWFVTNVNSNIANIKTNTGVNTMRIVVTTTTADADWQSCVQKCIDNKIIPMVELHDVTGNNTPSELNRMAQFWASKASYFNQPNIAKYILINIANEWSDWNMSATATGTVSRVTWRDAYITAVKTMRDAGIKTTLVLDAAGYGQDNKTQTILTYAKAVQASDPYHNCLFSVHMYCEWSVGGNSNVATLLPGIKNAGIPIIVGEFGWEEGNGSGGYCNIDETTIINTANSNGIGWIAWSWKGNGGAENVLDLSTDWAGTSLSAWGNTVVNGAGGTKTGITATVFTTTTTNPTPTVSITAPANNSGVCTGASVTITATAAVSSGTMNKVDFYDGNTLLGSDNTSPYSYTWNNPSVAAHTIRAIATSAANVSSVPATSTLSVNALPVIDFFAQTDGATWNQVTAVSLCAGTTLAMGPHPAVETGWSWTGPNGYTAAVREITMTAITAAQAGTYKATYKDANGCSNTASIVVTVNTSAAPTVTAQISYCQNATATVLTANGTALKWYTAATGGTSSTTAPIPSTSNTGTINYYVSQTTNTCESARAMIAVTVNALPSTPTVTASVNYCQNATAAALTANGTGLKWYTASSGGTSSTTAPIPSTGNTGTINYYVSQTSNGCESARAMIAVTVNPLPSAPTVTASVNYCQNATATALTANGTALKWYTAATGGTSSATAPTPSTANTGIINYYVSQTTNTCESTRAMIAVTVNALPSTPAVTASVNYCQNATAAALTANGTGLKWYTSATGGTASTTAPIPSTANTGTINYYVSQTSNGCESSRAMIAVTVNALPTATITTNGTTTVCQGGIVALSASTGSSYIWKNGTATVGTNQIFNANAGGSYTVEVTNAAGCKKTSAATTVTVTAPTTWYADADGDGKGDPNVTQSACAKPSGYVATAGDTCPADADKTAAGNCGCGNTENSCLDCAGVPNGTAAMDACQVCSGGTTGITPVTDASNCTTTATQTSQIQGLEIYPNPYEQEMVVRVPNGTFTLTLYNAAGLVVLKGSYTNQALISQDLMPGMYLLRIEQNDVIDMRKVIKK